MIWNASHCVHMSICNNICIFTIGCFKKFTWGYEFNRNHHPRITERSSSPKKIVRQHSWSVWWPAQKNLPVTLMSKPVSSVWLLSLSLKQTSYRWKPTATMRRKQFLQFKAWRSKTTNIKQIVKTSLAKYYSGTCWQQGDRLTTHLSFFVTFLAAEGCSSSVSACHTNFSTTNLPVYIVEMGQAVRTL